MHFFRDGFIQGRTGTIASCFLLYQGAVSTAPKALNIFTSKREIRMKMIIPSQKRWIGYFESYLRNDRQYNPTPILIHSIRLGTTQGFKNHHQFGKYIYRKQSVFQVLYLISITKCLILFTFIYLNRCGFRLDGWIFKEVHECFLWRRKERESRDHICSKVPQENGSRFSTEFLRTKPNDWDENFIMGPSSSLLDQHCILGRCYSSWVILNIYSFTKRCKKNSIMALIF